MIEYSVLTRLSHEIFYSLNTATISQEVKPPKIVLKLIPHSAGRWMTTDIPVQFQDETTEKLTAYCQRFGMLLASYKK